jgi:hypothetical protein
MSDEEPCYIRTEHTEGLWPVAGLMEVAQLGLVDMQEASQHREKCGGIDN